MIYIGGLENRRRRTLRIDRFGVKFEVIGLFQVGCRRLGAEWRAARRRDQRRGLERLGDVVGGLEDEESLATVAKLHGIVLFDAVDLELDLLLRRAQEREFAETDVER